MMWVFTLARYVVVPLVGLREWLSLTCGGAAILGNPPIIYFAPAFLSKGKISFFFNVFA